MITDMEGVDGIFDMQLQCVPFKSPRWAESQKLLTGEINAAVEGLFGGGATEVVVWDAHWGENQGASLSLLDLDPRARLLSGGIRVDVDDVLNPSYGALIFIGQHARAGADNGVLSHGDEIRTRTLLAGKLAVPAIMLSGDTAACKEIRQLVPQAECAEVKSGLSRNTAFMLPHAAACALIREKARRAMQRLPEFKPYSAGK